MKSNYWLADHSKDLVKDVTHTLIELTNVRTILRKRQCIGSSITILRLLILAHPLKTDVYKKKNLLKSTWIWPHPGHYKPNLTPYFHNPKQQINHDTTTYSLSPPSNYKGTHRTPFKKHVPCSDIHLLHAKSTVLVLLLMGRRDWDQFDRLTDPHFWPAGPRGQRCRVSCPALWSPGPQSPEAWHHRPSWAGPARALPASAPAASSLSGSPSGHQGRLPTITDLTVNRSWIRIHIWARTQVGIVMFSHCLQCRRHRCVSHLNT